MSGASKVVPFPNITALTPNLGAALGPRGDGVTHSTGRLEVERDRVLEAVGRELGQSLTLYQRIAIECELDAYAGAAVSLSRAQGDCW